VEPFEVRCETCHARLRVRDERVVGQIHACPKCDSMVLIAAPAGWAMTSIPNSPSPLATATGAAVPNATLPARQLSLEASAASSKVPTMIAHLAASPATFWSVAGVAILSAAGLGATFAMRGSSDQGAHPHQPPAAIAEAAPSDSTTNPTDSGVCVGLAAAMDAQSKIDLPADESAYKPVAGESTAEAAGAQGADSADATRTAMLPPAAQPAATEPANAGFGSTPRTLKLEPIAADAVASDAAAMERSPRETTSQYPPVADDAVSSAADSDGANANTPANNASPNAAVAPRPLLRFGPTAEDAARRANIADQVSVPIKSFDVSDAPLSRVLETLGNMAAVPITVDPAMLADAGVSPDAKITLHAHDTTLGKLLGSVLREHNLACEIRDGQLVIVGRSDATPSSR
jgi:hypothetical protein